MDYANEFWNITSNEYSAHHVRSIAEYPDLATSITNSFPIKKKYHSTTAQFVCPIIKERNPFHPAASKKQFYDSIEKYPDYVKLPYHTYDEFGWRDLTSVLVTEILEPKVSYMSGELLDRKKDYAIRGYQYIPIYYNEIVDSTKRQIIFSMLRSRMRWKFLDIYLFTGVKHRRFYARKCEIVELTSKDAKTFFDSNHIQGHVAASYYIGLKYNDEILVAMSLGKPRNSAQDWEIYRLATALNTHVPGGAERLWKHSKEKLNIKSCVSFCDVRFSSINPESTVYTLLGFKYEGFLSLIISIFLPITRCYQGRPVKRRICISYYQILTPRKQRCKIC